MTTLQVEIAERGLDLPLGFSEQCEGSKFHSPTPLVTLCYDLDGFAIGGFTLVEAARDAKEAVRLCGVCADNLGVFLLLAVSNDFPWEVQRQFGNRIRELAKRVMAHQGRE